MLARSRPSEPAAPSRPVTEHPQFVHVFSDDTAFLKGAMSALNVVPGYSVKGATASAFLEQRASSSATINILDIDDGSILAHPGLHDARRTLKPVTPFIVVSRELAPEHLRQVVRLNSTDWLKKPVDRRELLQAVSSGVRQHDSVGEVSVYVSATGGSGATTLAINAAYLAARRPKNAGASHLCMLFDLDFSAGYCGAYLDLENDYDPAGVLSNPDRIDMELVDIVARKHSSGFSLLSMRAPSMVFHPAGDEVVLRLLDVLALQYRRVVVDLPYYDAPWKMRIMEAADTVAIVTDCTVPSLKQAKALYLALLDRGATAGIRIIANRFHRSFFTRSLSQKEIESIFDGAPVMFLPDDWNSLTEAANRGAVPFELNPGSKYSKALRRGFQGRARLLRTKK